MAGRNISVTVERMWKAERINIFSETVQKEYMKRKKMKAYLSDGAKERLFKMAIKANDRIENCDSDEEYKAAKKRCAEWNEIILTLGLSEDLKRYYAEKRGEE